MAVLLAMSFRDMMTTDCRVRILLPCRLLSVAIPSAKVAQAKYTTAAGQTRRRDTCIKTTRPTQAHQAYYNRPTPRLHKDKMQCTRNAHNASAAGAHASGPAPSHVRFKKDWEMAWMGRKGW